MAVSRSLITMNYELFEKIILPDKSIENISYRKPFEIYESITTEGLLKPPIKTEDLLNAAEALCRSKLMEEKRDKIILFNQVIKEVNDD